LGLALQDEKKTGEAKKQFESALAISPGFVEPLTQLVAMDIAEGKPEAALERVRRQMGLAPKVPDFEFLLGRLHLSRQETALAESAFLRAIELDPQFDKAYVALSQLYAASGQYDQALAKLNGALQTNPRNLPVMMLSGMLYEQKGDIQRAQETYEQLLALNPRFFRAANNLAYLYGEHGGDPAKALKLAQQARDAAPEDPYIADTLGWILYKQGNYDWALVALQQSVSKLGDNAEVQYHLGMTQHRLGHREEAKQALQKALTLNPRFSGADEAKRVLGEM
jgi:tetratricopeptide (TPR) repeat protein